ncbi:hypothetical protein EYF80_000570 [Liparis tanakae]|uniref:Uncharacterized protein n=1 Tax=Liparis tanakae TaxID=230148 RepID=A0A4Z2JJ67_9TELE|nr:hypothetical protein EYF80_000570 [Liparis tanakae]
MAAGLSNQEQAVLGRLQLAHRLWTRDLAMKPTVAGSSLISGEVREIVTCILGSLLENITMFASSGTAFCFCFFSLLSCSFLARLLGLISTGSSGSVTVLIVTLRVHSLSWRLHGLLHLGSSCHDRRRRRHRIGAVTMLLPELLQEELVSCFGGGCMGGMFCCSC